MAPCGTNDMESVKDTLKLCLEYCKRAVDIWTSDPAKTQHCFDLIFASQGAYEYIQFRETSPTRREALTNIRVGILEQKLVPMLVYIHDTNDRRLTYFSLADCQKELYYLKNDESAKRAAISNYERCLPLLINAESFHTKYLLAHTYYWLGALHSKFTDSISETKTFVSFTKFLAIARETPEVAINGMLEASLAYVSARK